MLATFADDLSRAVNWEVEVGRDLTGYDLDVRYEPDLPHEHYRVRVDEVSTIEAGDPAGLAYALVALRQLGPVALWSAEPSELSVLELPCVELHDGPAFSWRGVHLDVARHFFGVDVVLRLIDQMAAHRLNRLHLHLNDDQGWRVDVPTWPRLASVGSRRRSSPVGHERDGRDDGVAHSGYFDADDLERIRDHGKSRFVQIVPEIDLPGHAQAAIAAYPELGNWREPREVWTRWGISDHVLNVSATALDFAEEIVTYVAGVFPDSPVHIGGDECPTTEWEESVDARVVMDEHGFSDARDLQGLFTQRMADALQRCGHEVVAWDEVLDAAVPAGTVIVAWRGVDRGVEAARRGFDVVMAPMQVLYFDWLSSDGSGEPIALTDVPDVTTWERVYQHRIVPETMSDDEAAHVRGAQAQLWTEYIASRDHLDYMAFPRLCAFSEVAWGTATTVEEFRPRLAHHLERLAAMGVRYRPLDES